MELTDIKRAVNTGDASELPGYSIGKIFKKGEFLGEGGGLDKFLGHKNDTFGTNGAAIGTAATGVLDMVGSIGAASKFNRTADDLLKDAGTSQQNIGGVGYTVQNGLDDKQIEQETNAESTSSTLGLTAKGAATGAAIASVIPGVGTAVGGIVGGVAGLIGGLFGGGAKKREMKRQMRLAEIKRINTNSFNQSGALTTVLQNNLAQTEGNQEDQALYGAADGKLPGFMNGFTPNCKLSNGEHVILHDPIGNPIADIPIGNGRDNKDTVKAFIPNNASVITNKYGASEYLEKTGDINGAEYLTAMNIQDKKYKNGKLPGFIDGYLSNIIGHGLPMLSEIFQGNKISSQDIEHNSTNVKNPFESQALYTLGQQRENPYAIIPELYDEYAKGMYAISNAGGLGGGQRALARLSAMNNFMNQSAKLQQAAQAANIGHRQTYANALLTAGSKSAENEAAAMRYDLDRYSRAHAAKLAGEQEARKGAWSQFMAGIKGIVDNSRYNEAMDLYRQKSKIENDYYEALTRNLQGNKVTADNSKDWSWLPEVYGPMNRNIQLTPSQIVPSALQDPMSLTNYLKRQQQKTYVPQLTKPSDIHSLTQDLLTKQDVQQNTQRPIGVVTPDSRENTLVGEAQLRSSGRYNFDNTAPTVNTQKSKKTLEDAKDIIKKHRGDRVRTRQTDMDFWKNQDNIKKLMQVYWDMTGVNKAY